MSKEGIVDIEEMEDEEEYSHSGASRISQRDISQSKEHEQLVSLQKMKKSVIVKSELTAEISWEDMRVENESLKDELGRQIAIFEQYLKVAVLQNKTRMKE